MEVLDKPYALIGSVACVSGWSFGVKNVRLEIKVLTSLQDHVTGILVLIIYFAEVVFFIGILPFFN